jgi:excisionase family DNA binding protein
MTETASDAPVLALAYPPAQAAKVVGRSKTRIKKAIREKELTALKDGRATLIEHNELQRWLSTLPTIGRPAVAA